MNPAADKPKGQSIFSLFKTILRFSYATNYICHFQQWRYLVGCQK